MEPVVLGAIVGVIVAVVAMVAMSLGKSSRDRVIFRSPVDVHGLARGWADHHGYRVVHDGHMLRLKKGKGLAVAAAEIEIERRGDEYKLETYSPFKGIGKTREIALTDSTFAAKVPRKKSMAEVDELLASLGQPPLLWKGPR